MKQRGEWVINGLKKRFPDKMLQYRMGFHAVPSLIHLHMHIIVINNNK